MSEFCFGGLAWVISVFESFIRLSCEVDDLLVEADYLNYFGVLSARERENDLR